MSITTIDVMCSERCIIEVSSLSQVDDEMPSSKPLAAAEKLDIPIFNRRYKQKIPFKLTRSVAPTTAMREVLAIVDVEFCSIGTWSKAFDVYDFESVLIPGDCPMMFSKKLRSANEHDCWIDADGLLIDKGFRHLGRVCAAKNHLKQRVIPYCRIQLGKSL